MSHCRIRRLESRDLPELVELCREHAAYERSAWVDEAPGDGPDRVARLSGIFLNGDDATCWVVESSQDRGSQDRGDRLVGFASVACQLSTWDASHYLYLDCLYLRDAYRSQGLGRQLIDEVLRAAQTMGAINVQWQTPACNEGAVRFYQRLGATSKEKLRFTLDAQSY